MQIQSGRTIPLIFLLPWGGWPEPRREGLRRGRPPRWDAGSTEQNRLPTGTRQADSLFPAWRRTDKEKKPGFRIRIQSGQLIRIRNQNPDPDPGGQKLLTKVGKNCEISCFEVLDILF
jgi:hypothetical protein